MDPMHTVTLLDQEAALERVGGDHDLLIEIAQLFLSETPGQLNSLVLAVEAGDSPSVEKTAHMIKGSIATFGADPAVRTALALEQAGRKDELSRAPALVEELKALVQALSSELQTL